ncbi:MAG: hypothetical protein LRY75_15725 [Shewanella xiamenensis]|nr:hypothetical protein [Shewanella xiamenensis]
MGISYVDEMKITQAFLEEMKCRLSDKRVDILPETGKYYDTVEPQRTSLIGCVGALPDPNFHGPQAPNSIGMVLLVSPDDSGHIVCKLSGRFDVCHRCIPNIADMTRDLIMNNDEARDRQIISAAFKRFTVTFDNLELRFTTAEKNSWVHAGNFLDEYENKWRADNRIFRRCHLSPSGGASFNLAWGHEPPVTQEDLDSLVYNQLFANPSEILAYGVGLRGRIRPAPHQFSMGEKKDVYFLELFLENLTSTDSARPFGMEFPYLLDARFRAAVEKGHCFKVPYRLKPEDYRLRAHEGLPGYGITCGVNEISPTVFETNPVPTFAQQRVDAPTYDSVGMPSPPHYSLLASKPLPVLDSFVVAMENYGAQWTTRIAELDTSELSEERAVAISDSHAFAAEIALIKDGINLLKKDENLLQCFKWMNEAMSRAITLQCKSFKGWHLFQLGFILTQVRSIYERYAGDDKAKKSWDYADVLWFATGGGKTEAYLGIISMAMLYARKSGREYGVTAWMRFPLRMLSVQQFQRLSYVLAQSNVIREREELGGWPFTIGYYTGNGTPNKISDSYNEANFLPMMSEEKLNELRFISDCPYCGETDSVHVKRDLVTARISHVCSNGDCWSNTRADAGNHRQGIRGEIGIYVSDEECYRYLPSVLVGTVDKLAVIGHNKNFANFFGAAKFYCPEHGFSQTSICDHKRIVKEGDAFKANPCGNNTRTSSLKVANVPVMKDRGISFAIQDELHLLRESLGNFDAHYESLMNSLQTAHGGHPIKVLAATATIKEFESHIHHLYLKQPRRFPSPGINQGESFYARKAVDPSNGEPLIRRWFAGILPIGRGNVAMKAVSEVSASYLDQLDEWRTALSNGNEELIERLGIDSAKVKDVVRYLEKNLNADLIYANNKRNILEVQRFMDERSGERDNNRSSLLLDANTRLDKILEAIHHVENKSPEDNCRTLVATSVVSHGVDIAELNFMVMGGWPKSTAEYIQASARSGRVHPGIVMCVLSSRLLFESGVFMNFSDMHMFLDKMVESVPINRFAPNVLDRTLPGILSAVILNWGRQQSWGADLNHNVKSLVTALQSTSGESVGNALKEIAFNSLGVPEGLHGVFDARVIAGFNRTLNEGMDRAIYELSRWPGAKHEQMLGEALKDIFAYAPLRSFRDIENQILIKPSNATSNRILTAVGR